MSGSGGQVSGGVLRDSCNIVWLPGIAPQVSAAGAVCRGQDNRSDFLASARRSSTFVHAAAAAACMAGQAAALPLLAAGGASGSPWIAGAVFGAAAAASSWAWARTGARQAGKAGRASGPADPVLNDAFTLALVLAASAVMGAPAAALLLPAGAVLAQAKDRSGRSGAAGKNGAMLLLGVVLAMAGLLSPSGVEEAAMAAIALAAITLMKAAHAQLQAPRLQIWQVWGASALLCAAIAAAGHGTAGTAARFSAGLALAAGVVYGVAAGAAAQLFTGAMAKVLAAAVPFLSAAAIAAFSGIVTLPQIAAAVLLAAAAAAGSRSLTAVPSGPAVSSPNGWPAGWF